MVLDRLQQRWPKNDLEYLRVLATTVIALLLLPLMIAHFLIHPWDVAEHALKSRVGA